MYSSKDLQKTIEEHLKKIDFNLKPVELYEPIEYVLSSGGKRLRPVLALMACNLFNESIDAAIDSALGIEIFHNFTLLHDDIMDHAELRRNQDTVHIKWDENRAILSGDAMSIKAYELLTKSPIETLKEVLNVFNQTALEVCEGQQIDMNFETRNKVSIDEYLEMIRLKTAVLIAGSLKIGALIGGANQQKAEQIYEFGKNIGLVFQLQDDLLDAFGDVKKFGKKIGGDILENKKTFLLIKAFELADTENKMILDKYIPGNGFDEDEKINSVLKVYNNLNIKEITKSKIQEYFVKANSYLDTIGIETSRKKVLKNFIEKLINRSY